MAIYVREHVPLECNSVTVQVYRPSKWYMCNQQAHERKGDCVMAAMFCLEVAGKLVVCSGCETRSL